MVIVSCPNIEVTSTYNLPSVPSGLNVENTASFSLYISWNESDRAEMYQLYRDINSNGSFSLLVYEGYATGYTDSNLDSYTTYYYKAKAINSFGSSGLSPYISGTTEQLGSAPSTPTGLTVSNQTVSSLTISWNISQDATSYQVYRDTNAQGNFAYLANNDNSTQFTDINLVGNTTYYYKVRATNSFGSSLLSNYVFGTTLTPPLTAPTGVSATDYYLDKIKITWNPVLGASYYEILMDSSPDGSFTTDPVGSTLDTYYDFYGGPTSVWVYFKVRARDGLEVGPLSYPAAAGLRTGW